MKNDNSDTGKNSRTSKGSRLKIENFYRLVLAYSRRSNNRVYQINVFNGNQWDAHDRVASK